jgi:hypothetical protein
MAVIGGGVVGMEWGALFAALGTRVTVLEMMPQILPMVEADMVTLYRRHFEKLGADVHTGARVEEVARRKGGLEVRFGAGGEARSVAAQVVLLATGRVPYTDGLGLEEAGVELERGRVVVDEHLRTSAPGVWAIGDVIGGIMLAHVASYEGVCAVENICGHADRVPDYHAAPNCIYTDPEIANVGLGEKEARERGHQVKVGRFPFAASGRALTLGQTEGAVKVVADAADDTVLGVQMVGPRVTDVIAEATLAVQQRLKLHDLDLTMHAHPTLAESLLEAALAADGRAIHIPNRKAQRAAAAEPTRTKETRMARVEEARQGDASVARARQASPLQTALRHGFRLLVAWPGRRRVAEEAQVAAGAGLELELPAGRDGQDAARTHAVDDWLGGRGTAPHPALAGQEVPDLLDRSVPDRLARSPRGQPYLDQAGPPRVRHQQSDLGAVGRDGVGHRGSLHGARSTIDGDERRTLRNLPALPGGRGSEQQLLAVRALAHGPALSALPAPAGPALRWVPAAAGGRPGPGSRRRYGCVTIS